MSPYFCDPWYLPSGKDFVAEDNEKQISGKYLQEHNPPKLDDNNNAAAIRLAAKLSNIYSHDENDVVKSFWTNVNARKIDCKAQENESTPKDSCGLIISHGSIVVLQTSLVSRPQVFEVNLMLNDAQREADNSMQSAWNDALSQLFLKRKKMEIRQLFIKMVNARVENYISHEFSEAHLSSRPPVNLGRTVTFEAPASIILDKFYSGVPPNILEDKCIESIAVVGAKLVPMQ